MLEQWLQTLETEKQKAIERIEKATNDSKIVDFAVKKIDDNYSIVEDFLKEMHIMRFKLNDDLSAIEEDYDNSLEYRAFYNHISHHLWEIKKNIPSQVEKGKFNPKLAKYY
ncbi:MAG: hypothetical protein WC781_01395 [Candidatus Pacearchaeota archaeon]|jgi:hypothetical protein